MTQTPHKLDVSDLRVDFPVGRRRPPFRAVDDVSFHIDGGETVGLVGESGSGKTTIGRAVLGLTPVTHGTIRFDDEDITHLSGRPRRTLTARLQVIFQDPYSSLNPTRTVGQTLSETARVHPSREKSVQSRVADVLEKVGLDADAADRHPSQFSGGQRQRIAIARALVVEPELIICDEPVSALDLSIQAQVLNLLRQLQEDLHLSYLFVAHDLAVVRFLSRRILVLYRGTIMEQGPAAEVYGAPRHPYTQALLAAAPVADPAEQRSRRERRRRITVEAAGRAEVATGGCPFAPRCPHAIDLCRSTRPVLEPTPNGGQVACHRWHEIEDPHDLAVATGATRWTVPTP
jgi:oligopeptide/dipeptide ABC transporter ATP-binding protein